MTARTRSYGLIICEPLAPDSGAVAAAVAAVHYTWAALAETAAADLRAVRAAVRAGRLYVPTRSLPAEYDVPRRFGPALPSQIADLQDAYQAAADTSAQAAIALGAVAEAVGAPSRVLALAHAAAAHQHRPVPRQHDESRNLAGQAARAGSGLAPGPVEQAVTQFGPVDDLVILRAAAIDRAAHSLLAGVARASGHAAAAGVAPPAGWWLSVGGEAAQIAAQAFPSGPAAWLADTRAHGPPDSGPDPPRRPRAPNTGRHAPGR